MDKFRTGDLLDPEEIRQVDHISDLLRHYARDEREKKAVEDFRLLSQEAMVRNQWKNAQRLDDGKITFQNNPMDDDDAPEVFGEYVNRTINHKPFYQEHVRETLEKRRALNKPPDKPDDGRLIASNPKGLLNLESSDVPTIQAQRPTPAEIRDQQPENKPPKPMPPDSNKTSDPSQKPAEKALLSTEERRVLMEKHIRDKYKLAEGQKLDWYQFADIADFVAQHTKNEEEFRQDLWYLFGTKVEGDKPGKLLQYFDTTNPGLPEKYHNMDEKGNPIVYGENRNPGEQLHHYLGGVTGDDGRFFGIPSHHLNAITLGGLNPASRLNELDEFRETGRRNKGDENLFDLARLHYYDFNKPGGRFTLGDNIRKVLKPRQQTK